MVTINNSYISNSRRFFLERDGVIIREGSPLDSIITGISEIGEIKDREIEKRLKNLNIETCDESYLSMFMSTNGISKIGIPVIKFNSLDSIIVVKPVGYTHFPDGSDGSLILSSGSTYSIGDVDIKVVNNVYSVAGAEEILVPCTITSDNNSTLFASYSLKVQTLAPMLFQVSLQAKNDIRFTYREEDTRVLRARIISYMKLLKEKKTKEAIESHLEKIEGIKAVDIISDKLYFETEDMFIYGNSSTSDRYKKIIESELLNILSNSSDSFTVIEKTPSDLIMSFLHDDQYSTEECKNDIRRILKLFYGSYSSIALDSINKIVSERSHKGITITQAFLRDSVTLYEYSEGKIDEETYIRLSLSNIFKG